MTLGRRPGGLVRVAGLAAALAVASCANEAIVPQSLGLERANAITARARALSFTDETPSQAWQMFAQQGEAATEPRAAQLFAYVAEEQYLRAMAFSPEALDGLNEEEVRAFQSALGARMGLVDARNRDWLKQSLDAEGWFARDRYGEWAGLAAWLIIQHADRDPEWQARMLPLMEELRDAGEVRPVDVAYLIDRVAVNAGRPQLYATQGRCVAQGLWEPRAFEGALDDVARRREEVGLEPLADYVARFGCPIAEGGAE